MILYYVRHGEPNYEHDCLTEKGKLQAEAIAKLLKQLHVDKVYASTMGRATETAMPTAKECNLPIIPCPWAREDLAWKNYTVKVKEGTTWVFWSKEMLDNFSSKETQEKGYEFYKLPAYESTNLPIGIPLTDKNVDEFMLSLGYRHDRENKYFIEEKKNDEHVALFAHHGFGLAFLSSLLDIPYSFFSLRADMCHTGLTTILFEPSLNGKVYPKILHLSDDAHLYEAGLLHDAPTELYIDTSGN